MATHSSILAWRILIDIGAYRSWGGEESDTIDQLSRGVHMETYTLPYVKEITSGNLLYDAGNSNLVFCDNLEGRDMGGSFKRGETCVYQ